VECVGSLLVPAAELQELSSQTQNESHSNYKVSPQANIQKRHTAVGTILVPPSELDSHPTRENEQGGKDEQDGKQESMMGSIRKRLTNHMGKPPPDENDPEYWAD